MLSLEMLWSARAAEFSQQRLKPTIPRQNLVIGGMRGACSRSARCISFSRLLFPPLPFFQASITGDYSALIVSFPPLFTAGALLSLFPFQYHEVHPLPAFLAQRALEKPSQQLLSLNTVLASPLSVSPAARSAGK